MTRTAVGCMAIVFVALSGGCVTLAPGAERVKITTQSKDVEGCAAVGNIMSQERNSPIDIDHELRNQAVGLQADTIFETALDRGVAYRCKAAQPSSPP